MIQVKLLGGISEFKYGFDHDEFAVGQTIHFFNRGLGFMGYIAVTIVLEIVLGLFASIIVMWFSRRREVRADRGAADLAGRQKMIDALKRLQAHHEPSKLPDQMAAFGIRPREGGLASLFRSHPPLEARIAALQNPEG